MRCALTLHRLPRRIEEPHAVGPQDGDLSVLEEDHVARVREDRRDVRGDEVLAFAEPDHDRRAIAHGDDGAGIGRGDDDQREQAAQPLQRSRHGGVQAVLGQFEADQVRHDFGVGLGAECDAASLQFPLQLEVVLDDPVVHENDAAALVAMRVSVLLGGTAVRGPARVTDAVRAGQRPLAKHGLEIGQLARAASHVDAVRADDGDAGRVVAAILEPAEPIEHHRDDFLMTDVSDDAAHVLILGGRLREPALPAKLVSRPEGPRPNAEGRCPTRPSVVVWPSRPCSPGGSSRCRGFPRGRPV